METRHSATLNLLTNSIPYPNPFDIPLVFDEVYSLAAPFIASCPDSNPPLPVKALPTIKISPKNGKVTDGAKVTVKPGGDFKKSSKGVSSNDVHGAFITAEGPKWVALVKSNDDEFDIDIPRGLHGLNYFVINKGKEKVTDETVLAGPAAIQVCFFQLLLLRVGGC